MPTTRSTLPARVVIIAGVIAVALGALVVMLNQLSRPAPAPIAKGEIGAGESLALEPEQDPTVVSDDPVATEPVETTLTLQLFVSDASGRQLITRIARIDRPERPSEQVRVVIDQLVATPGAPSV